MIAADIAMLEAVITGKVGGGPTAAVSDGVVIVSAFSGSSTSGEKTMRTEPAAPKDIDQYIARFPPDVQKTLETVRRTIRKAAPDAEETIKYQIPTFTLHGNLVHFAAYKTHIGVYPAPRGNPKFKHILSGYEGGKGTVRFPLDKPMPLDVISKIVEFRVEENLKKAARKRRA